MTKQEKIASLSKAMQSRLVNEETQWHFTGEAPKEFVDLYLKHYEVRDIDYETFSRACDIVSEIYSEKPNATEDEVTDDIYERASESANPYIAVQLSYLNIWNQDEITEYVRTLGLNIAQACAVWYDKQIEQSAVLINEWVNA